MSSAGSLSRRYAKALLQLGVEHKCFEQLGQELNGFAKLLENRELHYALTNPSYDLATRRSVMQGVIDRVSPSKTFQNFALLAMDRNRVTLIPDIAREYQALADEQAGQVRATITSATALDGAAEAELKKALEAKTGKKVLLTTAVDDGLIAGTVTQIGSLVFDGSLQTQLDQMKQTLLQVS